MKKTQKHKILVERRAGLGFGKRIYYIDSKNMMLNLNFETVLLCNNRSKDQKRNVSKKSKSLVQQKFNEQIITLRHDFNPSTVHAFLCHLSTLTITEQEYNLLGKELGKIWKVLGQPSLMRKKNNKQIQTLIQTINGRELDIKFPVQLLHR